MMLCLDCQFVLLPLRGSPSFIVLHAQHGNDTQGLSCLLPRSWCDNPETVPSLDGLIRCETDSCILHNLACIRTSLEYLARFACSLALGALRRARMVVHPDSGLDVEHQAVHLSKHQRVPTESPLDRVQILQRRLFRHHLHCPRFDHKTVSPWCHNVFFGMEMFPSQVPKCHLSVMTPPGTFPATRNITAEHSSMLTSLKSLMNRFAITRHMTRVQNVRCVLDNPRKQKRVDGDWTPDST